MVESTIYRFEAVSEFIVYTYLFTKRPSNGAFYIIVSAQVSVIGISEVYIYFGGGISYMLGLLGHISRALEMVTIHVANFSFNSRVLRDNWASPKVGKSSFSQGFSLKLIR